MKLQTLRLKNFRQHADTEVAFPDAGITGIVGTNESGKSTLLEATTWALYGSKAVRGTKDGIRWNRAPARHVAEAELRFEVGGTRYRVERTESNAKVFLESEDTPVAEGTSAVDEYLPERIGMTLEEFSATYLCQQKDLPRLAAMGPTERQTFVRSVMGLDRIDEALKACRSKKNDLGREREGLAAGLGERAPLEKELEDAAGRAEFVLGQAQDLAGAAAEAGARVEETDARLARLEEAKRRRDELVRDRGAAARNAADVCADLESVRADLARAKEAAAKLERVEPKLAKLPALHERRDELRDARAAAGERKTLTSTIERLESEIDRVETQMVEAAEQKSAYTKGALEDARAEYERIREQLDNLRAERERARAQAEARLDAADAEVQSLDGQIEAISDAGMDGDCPMCARPLGGQLDDVLASLRTRQHSKVVARRDAGHAIQDLIEPSEDERRLQRDLAEVRDRGERLKEAKLAADAATRRRQDLDIRIRSTERELRGARERLAELPDVTGDADALAEVERRIHALEGLERSEAIPARALVAQGESLSRREAQLVERLETADRARDRAGAELRELDFDEAAHADAKAADEEAEAFRRQVREDLARAQAAQNAAVERRQRAETALAAYDERAGRLTELSEALRVHTAAADRLDTFRLEQASMIRPELEELVSGFMATLTDGRHDAATVTEDFDVVLQESGLDAPVVSGGTEDVAALAMRLAISQMIAERAGHPLSLLVLDEPFGSLDEVRRAAVLNLIRRLSGTFEQVLVISHVAETKDAVDAVVEVAYDEAEGCSRARVLGAAPASEPAAALAVA